jgi:competence protein ComEC
MTRYTVKPNFLEECSDEELASATGASTRKNSAEFYPCPQKNIPLKNLILLINDRFPEFRYGDQVKVTGQLDLPKNFESENGVEFDYVSYLAKDQIHFLLYRPTITKTGEAPNFILNKLYLFKKILIKNIERVVPEPNSALLAGIIFGTKQSLGQELLTDFQKVGLIHIVVLSGYNITIIAIGIFYLTNFFGKRNLGFILSIFFISLFVLMVGLSATVIRACIMSFLAILAKFLGRPNDGLRWLLIAGILMLIWNPIIIFADPSFQLSFLATLGLILFSQPIQIFFAKNRIGKWLPEKFGIREIVASTLAVQIFILPLLIKMSGFVSLISFLLNPIILPLVPTTMLLGILTSVLGLLPIVGKILAWPFGTLAYFLTQLIIWLTESASQFAFATLTIGQLPIWIIFVWYGFYGVLFSKLKNNSPHPTSGHPPLD